MPKYYKHAKTFLPLFILIFSVFFIVGCKKGENDPFLSLRSRKARLTGDWELKNGFETMNINGIEINIEYTDNTKTINGNEYPYSEKLNFDKKGEFEWIFKDNNATITEKGSWEFGRRNKSMDYKSKETVNLFISEKTTSGGATSESEYFEGDYILIDGNDNTKTLVLDELRNKTLVIKSKGTHTIEGIQVLYEINKEYKQ